MCGKVVVLQTAELMPIEAAAEILAWIVYPTRPQSRERYARAIVLLTPRESAKRDVRWQNEVIPIKAGMLIPDPSSAETFVHKSWLTLRRRILAGNMALPLIAKSAGFEVRLAPDGIALSSLNQLIGMTAELIGGEGGGNDRNIKSRVWGESKPVLHLCAAYIAVVLQRLNKKWAGNLWGLLADPDAIHNLVELAEKFRPVIADWQKPGPTVDPKKQVQIQLVS